jgi:photosystem II stability/assembly factor-like uncharacterized protein
MKLYLATREGLVVAEGSGGEWQVIHRGLDGREVTAVIAREDTVLAGTTDGIFRSIDDGETWQEASQGLAVRHVRRLAYHPDISDFEMAGTEPAALFVSSDGGESWQERAEVSNMRDRFGWWLPYSPEAGCVRGFAAHGERLYAAVEVGGLLRSDDGGQSWNLAPGSDGQPRFGKPAEKKVHPDVHDVFVHASSPELLYAPTGGGFYTSQDGGATWTSPYQNCYVRAVWVDPQNPRLIVLGPSEGPDGREGRIEISEDGGQHWQPVTERWQANMVERFHPVDGTLLAVLANGQLLAASGASFKWTQVLEDVSEILDVSSKPR